VTVASLKGTLSQHRLGGWWPGLPGWLRSAVEWIGIGLVGIAVLGLVFVAMAPRVLGWNFVVVAGGSMEPAIGFGSVAVMENVKPASVQVGDIVMYKDPRNGKVVTHRIVQVSDDGQQLTTRGDANNTADEGTLPRTAIRGEYLFSVPQVGKFVHWMGTRQGYMSLILVPGVVIIALELVSVGKEIRAGRRKKPGNAPAPPLRSDAGIE
jgi:signal peptidase